MAGSQNRRRQRAGTLSRDNSSAKRTGAVSEPGNFTPAFWDHLSRFWLTPCALRELSRRNSVYTVAQIFVTFEAEEVVFQNNVIAKITPVIYGKANIPNKQNVTFAELTDYDRKYIEADAGLFRRGVPSGFEHGGSQRPEPQTDHRSDEIPKSPGSTEFLLRGQGARMDMLL
ncbi:hypothetical protein GGS23DRAFT_593106 [Durotheca rogersii]|uniref:uncharacterized protein n=1 Tax=Durotheca rogersii TaxID=419775 RepID=UPI00221ECE6E|nr:uncharacterized protein GGS23DRAFT_593106 [Durotheca rogersii]KAI5867838.1 hypothetical protein GGS23DRAFT_593106 [Durotheca rogersii]